MRTKSFALLVAMLAGTTAGAGCAHRRTTDSGTREVREVREERAVRVAEARDGWVRLGERSVDGAHDRDVIAVGGKEGTFRKLMIAVERNPIELHHVVVTFRDGSQYAPETKLVFGANTRSSVIDLPGRDRIIRSVEFRYGNLPGTGRAEVELWGR
jgi:hypothetical protein